MYFNPRPREEGDQLLILVLCQMWISIHALVKRATDWEANFPDMYDISIHALVKRATIVNALTFAAVGYFNPRPREEGDAHPRKLNLHKILFQSTPS